MRQRGRVGQHSGSQVAFLRRPRGFADVRRHQAAGHGRCRRRRPVRAWAPTPCCLIRASPDPFSDAERRLAPTMRISLSAGPEAGRLRRPRDRLGRARPPRRAAWRVRARRAGRERHGTVLRGRLLATPRREAYKSTSLAAATGANGRWSIALPVPPAQLVFTAVTEGLPERTFAIRGTAASVHARITLAVAGNSFSGTVAPAQPGRSVRLQIRTKRTCSTPPPNGPTICTDEYATVARAPLDAAGKRPWPAGRRHPARRSWPRAHGSCPGSTPPRCRRRRRRRRGIV